MLRRLLASLRGPARAAAPPAGPAAPADPVQEARAAYREGRHADVVRINGAMPASQARSLEGAMELAHSLQYLGRFADAATIYETLGRAVDSGGTADQQGLFALHLGLARLRQGDFPGADAAFRKVLATAPERYSARRIAAFPGIMSRPFPLAREPLPPMPASTPRPPATLDVVYFFTAPDDPDRADEYWRLFERSLASAREVYPGARLVLLTDESTGIPGSVRFDLVLREPMPPGELMPNRFRAIRAYLAHVATSGGTGAALMTESDCIMVRDMRDLLSRGAALYLTYRSDYVREAEDLEPCNTGVMLLDLSQPGALRAFFDACALALIDLEQRDDVREAYDRPIRQWRGDQLAVGAVIDWRTFQEHVLARRTDRLSIAGCAVGFLPSELYNFAPPPDADPASLRDRYVLHYKGSRKDILLRDGPAAAPR